MSLKLPTRLAERLRSVSAKLLSSASQMKAIWLRASHSVVSFVSGSSPSIRVSRLSFIHSVRSSSRYCSTFGSISSMRFWLTSRWRSCTHASTPATLSSPQSVIDSRCSFTSRRSPTARGTVCSWIESSCRLTKSPRSSALIVEYMKSSSRLTSLHFSRNSSSSMLGWRNSSSVMPCWPAQ